MRSIPSAPATARPAITSTYTAISHGVVVGEATVLPGLSHDRAWSMANAAWERAGEDGATA